MWWRFIARSKSYPTIEITVHTPVADREEAFKKVRKGYELTKVEMFGDIERFLQIGEYELTLLNYNKERDKA